MVSGQDKCKELERNELGQPIGDNLVKCASFLGCMIKEFVPYTLNGLNEIGEEVKDRMWSCLQLSYKVEDWERKVIFQKLAKLWRDRKFKLQILVREVNTGRVASRDLNLLKLEFMEQNQWDLFVKKTLSPTFQILKKQQNFSCKDRHYTTEQMKSTNLKLKFILILDGIWPLQN
ncbi:hypothetical protein ZIOFF_070020 [Zingiber officinale]|uniref:Uncharacterized protein n=1 Tax=Zingiber officinale TaxID=94328 RepID=A0A8J5CEG8_ZINOF|nr:hypothetical protein ZIOFF_070020 [Zingiber officinale]